MICPNCGDNIEGEAGFCPTCGAKIEAAAETITEAMNAPVGNEAPKKSKKKLIIAVVAVVAVISIIVALVMPYMTKHKYDGKYYYVYQEFIGDSSKRINYFSRENYVLTEEIDKSRYIEIKGDKATLYDGKRKQEYTDIKFEGDKITGTGIGFNDITMEKQEYHFEWDYDSKEKVIYVPGTALMAFKK